METETETEIDTKPFTAIRNMETEAETDTRPFTAIRNTETETEADTRPFTATFDNYDEAKQLIADYERKHVLQFALFKGVAKNFGQTDIFATAHKVYWSNERVPYSGTPFTHTGGYLLECKFGRGHHKRKSDKKKSMKLGCPALLKVFEFATYPDHHLEKDTAWFRKTVSHKLRSALVAKDINAVGTVIRKFVVEIPDISEHKGHPTGEAAGINQTLDKRLSDKIIQLVHEGVTNIKEMKRCLKVYVQEICEGNLPQKTNRRYYPPDRTIRNHIYMAKRRFRRSMVDQVDLLGKVKQWQEDKPEARIFFRPTGEESNILAGDVVIDIEDGAQNTKSSLLFIYQEDYQRNLLHRYGNELSLLDPAYRRASYLLPLYFLLVRTNLDYQIAAVFIMESEGKEEIMEALNILKEWNPEWAPKFFMTDYSNDEIDAVQKVFDSKVVLCDFLRDHAWKDWLSKLNNDCRDIKGFLLPMMRSVARSTLVEGMENAIGILKGCQYWEERLKFQEYFTSYWLKKKELWVWAYRDSRMHININTNNGIESQNEYLKYKFLEDHQNKSITVMSTVLVEEFFPESFERYCCLNKMAYSSYFLYDKEIKELAPYLINRPTAMVKHCLDRITSTSDKSIITCSDDGLFTVSSLGKNQNLSFDISFGDFENMPYCTCPDWKTSLFPCKHFFTIIQKYPTYLSWESLPGIYKNSPFLTLDVKEIIVVDGIDNVDVDNEVCLNTIYDDDNDVDFNGNDEGHSDSSVDDDVSYAQSHHTAESSRAIIKRIKDMSYELVDPSHLNEFYEGLKELENRFQPLVVQNDEPPGGNYGNYVKRKVDKTGEKPIKRTKRKLENC